MEQSEKTLDMIVNLCKNRGYVFPGSEIYGGLANSWDYGPLGVEFKNNVKKAWLKKFVQESPYNVGLDAAIIMNPQTWVTTGHVAGFSDPLLDCRACKARHRADKLIGDEHPEVNVDAMSFDEMDAFIAEHEDIVCPVCGKHDFTPIRKFNLMFKTAIGVTEDSSSTCYLRPETAQGIFVNFANIQRTTRRKLPFGVCQVGKAFRNEITPGNFTFRTREFEQMECEFFCKPGTDLEWFSLLEGLLRELAAEPRHQEGAPAPARPRACRAGLLQPRHHRHRVRLPVHRLGRAVGHCRPHQLRPEPPSGGLRQEPRVLRQRDQRALHPLRHRALSGLRPRGAGLPVRGLRRGASDRQQGQGGRPHRPASAPGSGSLQVRRPAPEQEAGRQGHGDPQRAEQVLHGGLRRYRLHRQALPP